VDGEYLQRRRGFGLAFCESNRDLGSLETGTRFRADLVSGRPCGTRALGRCELAVWLWSVEPPRPLLLLKASWGPAKNQPAFQGLAAALGIEAKPVHQPSFALASTTAAREGVSAHLVHLDPPPGAGRFRR